MKLSLVALQLVAVLAFTGCNLGTSGGPGATQSEGRHLIGQDDETFNLGLTETKLRQGETKAVSISIKRALNFDEDVTLKFADLPRGLSVDDSSPVIKSGDSEARFVLTASDDASLGDFSLVVTGHPTKGRDATNKLNVTVDKE